MTGGSEADSFQFAAADSGLPAASDQILDFVSGEDHIVLKEMHLNFVGTAAFTAGDTYAEVRWNAAGTLLEIDLNGDDVADGHIRLQTGSTVIADDLIL